MVVEVVEEDVVGMVAVVVVEDVVVVVDVVVVSIVVVVAVFSGAWGTLILSDRTSE